MEKLAHSSQACTVHSRQRAIDGQRSEVAKHLYLEDKKSPRWIKTHLVQLISQSSLPDASWEQAQNQKDTFISLPVLYLLGLGFNLGHLY